MTATRHIVVGIDGSEGSRYALRWAAAEARQWGARLEAVSVWSYPAMAEAPSYGLRPPDEQRADLEQAQEDVCRTLMQQEGLDDGDRDVELRLIEGSAGSALLDAAAGSDLLVVGARGHGGLVGLVLGSVSIHCATHAEVPVVIVHQPRKE